MSATGLRRALQIQLHEVDSATTLLEGRPSDVVGHIVIKAEEIRGQTSKRYEHPHLRRVAVGEVSQVVIGIYDPATNRPINNRGMPVILTLALN